MIHVGNIAREMREAFGLTQQQMAERLGVTNVHISNIENNKSFPSQNLIERYREKCGIDLYVMAWCRQGNVELLPASLRKPANELAQAFQHRFDEVVKHYRIESE